MKENTIMYENQSNSAKSAAEGREKIWGRKYFRFLKTNKKTLFGWILGSESSKSQEWCRTEIDALMPDIFSLIVRSYPMRQSFLP